MDIYLPDSNILIDALNDKRGKFILLESLLEQKKLLACCAVTVAEVFAGFKPSEMARAERLFSSLIFYDITFACARLAGKFRLEYSKKGRNLSLDDCLIAAAAIENDLCLITDNLKDFPMPELKLYRK